MVQVWQCCLYAKVGHACRESFEQALHDAHGAQELPENIRSQIHRAHWGLSQQMPATAFPANMSFKSGSYSHSKRGQKAPKDNKSKRMLEDGAPVTFDELRQLQAQHAVKSTVPVLSDGQLSKMWQAMPRAGAPGLTRDDDWPTRNRHCTGLV